MKRLFTLLLLGFSSAALAESGAYRVEVIIFRNLTATAEITVAPELRSFSHYPDLQDNAQAQRSDEGQADDRQRESAAVPDEILPNDLPDDVRVVNEKSSTMDGVWRRLRSSENYRPLIFAAWEQNRVDYYPPIRIHDGQVIDTRLRPPTQTVVADLTAPDPLGAYRSTFYQLDGSLQLRRSRFLHLSLDFEYREQNRQTSGEAVYPQAAEPGAGQVGAADDPGIYRIYTLSQNRQINTGEMQYFDTPFYGALVYVTAIE